MGTIETSFAELIWTHEPITSTELVKLCAEKLDWKKSTTYTVLRRLCDKGIFVNRDGAVSSLMSREEYFARRSENFVEETFEGSLPAFLAAFTLRKKLNAEEAAALRRMIDEYEETK